MAEDRSTSRYRVSKGFDAQFLTRRHRRTARPATPKASRDNETCSGTAVGTICNVSESAFVPVPHVQIYVPVTPRLAKVAPAYSVDPLN
jgi:hypothetical protein